MTGSSRRNDTERMIAINGDRLSMQWRSAMLRDIRLDGRLIYRAIGFVVRDQYWNTVPIRSQIIDHVSGDHCERLTIQLVHEGFGIRVRSVTKMTVDESGMQFTVTANNEITAGFNRIGIVVLHPMPELAGTEYRITHIDEKTSSGEFPELIGPPPLFTSVRSISHAVEDGAWVNCRFTGEAFETEDQRAFSDASLKTYSRSNASPRPFQLKKGQEIIQSAEISWTGRRLGPLDVEPLTETGISLQTDGQQPPLGLMLTTPLSLPTDVIVENVRDSGTRFLLCRLDRHMDARAIHRLAEAANESRLPVVLEIDEAVSSGAAELIRQAADLFDRDPITRIRLLPSVSDVEETVRLIWSDAELIVSATRGLIDLLVHPLPTWAKAVAFATSAIVHDADTRTTMESRNSLPAMIATCRKRFGLPVDIGPSTIGTLKHPHMAEPLDNSEKTALPMAAYCPLIDTNLATDWTLGFLARTAKHARSICLFTSHGSNGLFDQRGHPRPAIGVFRKFANSPNIR